jgi:alkanesulfonate monooxygenase SsuD/methylene tetrahydromethanopterin reductase-like flavin-dependent oxidoreductase (luciferase family)
MRIGVVFPQTELGGDAGAVRAYAQRAEELGFTHVLAYDHVAGADPAVHVGWDGPYDVHTTFHEPMVLYGYLAAVTSMELVTGVLILPQRQTILVAKQAAEVDLALASAGTASSTRPSARTSARAASAWRSRSRCCAGCGPSRP